MCYCTGWLLCYIFVPKTVNHETASKIFIAKAARKMLVKLTLSLSPFFRSQVQEFQLDLLSIGIEIRWTSNMCATPDSMASSLHWKTVKTRIERRERCCTGLKVCFYFGWEKNLLFLPNNKKWSNTSFLVLFHLKVSIIIVKHV